MSPDTLHGAALLAALVGAVSLVSILQAGDWARVSILGRHYFSNCITTMDWHDDSIEQAVIGLSE